MKFFVVENRETDVLALCRASADQAGVRLETVANVESKRFDEFKSRYVHRSTNSKDFELICFRRYFLLREHLENLGSTEAFVLLDSDVLVFKGIAEHIKKIAGGDCFVGSFISHSHCADSQISPHVSYWTMEGLIEFTDYLSGAYRDPDISKRMETIWEGFRRAGIRGGISDMTLLYLWREGKPLRAINAGVDGCAIDHNISLGANHLANEYVTSCGAKKVVFTAAGPFFCRRADGALVRVLAMHFQGKAKLHMRATFEHRRVSALLLRGYVSAGRRVKAALHYLRSGPM